MNFKPMKWKIIISILVIILWLVLFNFINSSVYCKPTTLRVCEVSDYDKFMIVKPLCDNKCQSLGEAVLSNIENIFIPFLLVYIILSLIQKK